MGILAAKVKKHRCARGGIGRRARFRFLFWGSHGGAGFEDVGFFVGGFLSFRFLVVVGNAVLGWVFIGGGHLRWAFFVRW